MHAVQELIYQRQQGIPDNHVLAIAAESDGLRGTLTGAMMAELEALGISPALFNFVVGASAGVTNGAAWSKVGASLAGLALSRYLNYRAHDPLESLAKL